MDRVTREKIHQLAWEHLYVSRRLDGEYYVMGVDYLIDALVEANLLPINYAPMAEPQA